MCNNQTSVYLLTFQNSIFKIKRSNAFLERQFITEKFPTRRTPNVCQIIIANKEVSTVEICWLVWNLLLRRCIRTFYLSAVSKAASSSGSVTGREHTCCLHTKAVARPCSIFILLMTLFFWNSVLPKFSWSANNTILPKTNVFWATLSNAFVSSASFFPAM